VATKCASRPTPASIETERVAWERAGAARKAAIFRQLCDSIVREATAEVSCLYLMMLH
jgi:hypothetical protein